MSHSHLLVYLDRYERSTDSTDHSRTTRHVALSAAADGTARALTAIVRNDAKTDWQVKETVSAKLRTRIKRLLLKHGYPPDKEPLATELIIQQAEQIAEADAA